MSAIRTAKRGTGQLGASRPRKKRLEVGDRKTDKLVKEQLKQQTEDEIKRKSDERRARRGKQQIRVEKDRIVDLTEEAKQLRANAVEVKPTGYYSECRVVSRPSMLNPIRRAINWLFSWTQLPGENMLNYKLIKRIELKKKFVEEKMGTRCGVCFKAKGRDEAAIQMVPLQYGSRTSVFHIHDKSFGLFRRYSCYADLDMVPEPQEIFRITGVYPLERSHVYKLREQTAKDVYLGDVFNYVLEP